MIKNIQIRQAQVSDISSIQSLANCLVVKSRDLGKTTGFYNYFLTENQYFNRIASPFFFVAENQDGLEGFCMGYDSEFLRALTEKEKELRGDVILNCLLELNPPWVYVDQFAVREPGTVTGSLIAYNLRNSVIDETRKANIHSILGAVVHKPWENTSAVKFVKKSGFQLQQEVESKGILFGIYQLNL